MARSRRKALIIVVSMMGLTIMDKYEDPAQGASQAFTSEKEHPPRGGVGRKLASRGPERDFIELKTHPPLIPAFTLISRSYGEILRFRGFSKSRICLHSEGHPIIIKLYKTIAYAEKIEKIARTVEKHIRKILPRGRGDQRKRHLFNRSPRYRFGDL
jgi:hypothetical protein